MQEEGTTEDETVGRHHRLDGHEFEQALGVGEGQGSLACCSPCGRKESDTTERLNNSKSHEHELYSSSVCCARPILNANVGGFISYVESLKLHSLYFAAYNTYVFSCV